MASEKPTENDLAQKLSSIMKTRAYLELGSMNMRKLDQTNLLPIFNGCNYIFTWVEREKTFQVGLDVNFLPVKNTQYESEDELTSTTSLNSNELDRRLNLFVNLNDIHGYVDKIANTPGGLDGIAEFMRTLSEGLSIDQGITMETLTAYTEEIRKKISGEAELKKDIEITKQTERERKSKVHNLIFGLSGRGLLYQNLSAQDILLKMAEEEISTCNYDNANLKDNFGYEPEDFGKKRAVVDLFFPAINKKFQWIAFLKTETDIIALMVDFNKKSVEDYKFLAVKKNNPIR